MRVYNIVSATLASFVSLGLFSGFLIGCSDDDLPKYVELGGLRILALQADSGGYAEVAPGDTVTITPYISDFASGTRVISYSWQACPDPGVAVGVQPSCEGVTGATAVTTGTVGSGGFTTSTARTGSVDSFSVSIPSTLLTGRSSQDQYNGVNYLVTYTISAPNGSTVSSFKRVVVSSKTTKNLNPTLSTPAVLANGVALSNLPSGDVEIRIDYPTASIETYSVQNSGGDLTTETEELLITWFISNGSLKTFRAVNNQTTTYTPPESAPSGYTPVLVAVVRDGRGGIAVQVLELP